MKKDKRKRNKPGRITAWLITWEWSGDHAARQNNIAAILNRITSPETIIEIVNAIYMKECYTLEEIVAFTRKKELNPYPAEYDRLNGVPWRDRIICGHNPFLLARIVDNLYVKKSDDHHQLLYEERTAPNMSWIHHK